MGIAGHATGNDFSARDPQTATSRFVVGKTPDDFGPIGPWLVTGDRVPDPEDLGRAVDDPAGRDPVLRPPAPGDVNVIVTFSPDGDTPPPRAARMHC